MTKVSVPETTYDLPTISYGNYDKTTTIRLTY